MNPFETAQCTVSLLVLCLFRPDINLNDFVSREAVPVLYLGFNNNASLFGALHCFSNRVFSADHFSTCHKTVPVCKPVSKGILGIFPEIPIRSALHVIGCKFRHITDTPVKCNRQLARRGNLSEKNICKRVSSLFSRIPEVKDGVRMGLRKRKVDIASGHKHRDRRFPGCRHCFKQPLLGGRK